MKNARRLATLMLAIVTLLGLGAAAANAAPAAPGRALDVLGQRATTAAQLQRQIDLQLTLAPGGVQTAANEVSYDGGRFVVTYALPGARAALAAADCPSGWFCFYDHTNYGYPRGRLSDCGWQDLGAYGWNDRTESVDNSTGNTVDYINHEDYGNPANGHVYDYHLFYNYGHSSASSVGYPNQADHVNRLC
ncbi:peptidase inhibitor family I36 protein [Krasilnikovia sp. MM14-A1004]|uniref:peptidase inhibitor family I36 protein n=1 Tax=Krasilnikovia sp. MM14-A1004 TaxID=3373541 RepID=UPI00399D4CF0